MAIKQILTIPDPFLKYKVLYVVNIDDYVRSIIHSMIETMHFHPHCVGLAAPQLGIDMRIVVVDVSLYPKKHPNSGLIALVNPMIVKSAGRQTAREGCLSVLEFTGNVSRADEIEVQGSDLNGNKVELAAKGFESVVLQHEIDHLDGILFLDRVNSLKTDVFRRKQVCLPQKK